jgi:hypothetical protein
MRGPQPFVRSFAEGRPLPCPVTLPLFVIPGLTRDPASFATPAAKAGLRIGSGVASWSEMSDAFRESCEVLAAPGHSELVHCHRSPSQFTLTWSGAR